MVLMLTPDVQAPALEVVAVVQCRSGRTTGCTWSGPLFVAINKGGKLGRRGMSGQAMLYIAHRRTIQSSVAAFSAHGLRRTFVGELLDAGADLSTVQQLDGRTAREASTPLRRLWGCHDSLFRRTRIPARRRAGIRAFGTPELSDAARPPGRARR
jgi:integrase